jgi:hypothetical protein
VVPEEDHSAGSYCRNGQPLAYRLARTVEGNPRVAAATAAGAAHHKPGLSEAGLGLWALCM